MTRSFEPTPLAPEVIDRIVGAGLRAPSAGNTQGTDLVVLDGPDQTRRYWEVTLPADARPTFRWPRLLDAPLLVLPFADARAYVARYAEADKAATGLGAGPDRWSVPYWEVDAAFTAMLVMLAAIDEGLGVLFFGVFHHEAAVKEALGVPPDRRLIGTLAIGHATGDEHAGRSANRPRRPFGEVVHRGGW